MEKSNVTNHILAYMHRKISAKEFEQWIYTSQDLEKQIGQKKYFQLLELDYRDHRLDLTLFPILESIVGVATFENSFFLQLIQRLRKRESFPEAILVLYERYCQGYYFLEDLAMHWGICIVSALQGFETWSDVSKGRRDKILQDFDWKQIHEAIDRLEKWLERDEIILTGEKNEWNQFVFIDRRPRAERKASFTKPKSFLNRLKRFFIM